MIRLSVGSTCVLGLSNSRVDAAPTTAYMLAGNGDCLRDCAFCGQARSASAGAGQLSRVLWPAYDSDEVISRVRTAYRQGLIGRACIQVVYNPESRKKAAETLGALRAACDIPVSLSSVVNTVDDARELLNGGADRISIALDAATPELHRRLKGGGFRAQLRLLKQAAREFPGRITTHLVVGLGETEEQLVTLMQDLVSGGVRVSLFAFTPVRATRLGDRPQPPVMLYRRVQLARQLMVDGFATLSDFDFDKQGSIVSCGLRRDQLERYLAETRCAAFRTSGCPNCNRPYYNERPGQRPYNYPRPLTDDEVRLELEETLATLYQPEGGRHDVAGT